MKGLMSLLKNILILIGIFITISIIFILFGESNEGTERITPMVIPTLESEPTQTPIAEIKTEQTRKVSETEYKKEMQYVGDNLFNSLNFVGDLTSIKPYPKLWTNKEKQLVIFHIFLLQELYPYAKELEPPVKFKEAHDLYLASLNKVREAMIMLEEAIDSPVKEMIEKADRTTDLLRKSRILLEKANRVYDSL